MLAARAGPPAAASAAGVPLRVAIGRALGEAELGGPDGLTLRGPDGAELGRVAAGQVVRFRPAAAPGAGAIEVRTPDGEFQSAGPVRVVPQPGDGDAFFRFGGRRYRGEAEVLAAGGGLTVVNVVGLEDYLRGVLPGEMPARSFPEEALKAQAVVARTYALRIREQGSFRAEGFDLPADTSGQVYLGADAEQPATDAAVQATAGEVVLYGGELALTLYHASSGGHTEDNEVVFTGGQPVPYLRGVPDPDQDSPYYRWETVMELDRLREALRGKLPADVGEVVAIEPAGRQGSGGRWSHWRVRGTRGEVRITGTELRNALGLRSNPRAVEPVGGGPGPMRRTYSASDEVAVLGASGSVRRVPVRGVAVAGTPERPPGSPAHAAGAAGAPSPPGWIAGASRTAIVVEGAPAEQAAGVRISGGGHGHGVGLSQWGARALALAGKRYDEIIRYYYQGARVAPYPG